MLRALKLHKSGRCAHVGDFSGNLIEADRAEFAEFIDVKVDTWAKIIHDAQEYVPSGSRRSSSRPKAAVEQKTRRAVVRDDSDDE